MQSFRRCQKPREKIERSLQLPLFANRGKYSTELERAQRVEGKVALGTNPFYKYNERCYVISKRK